VTVVEDRPVRTEVEPEPAPVTDRGRDVPDTVEQSEPAEAPLPLGWLAAAWIVITVIGVALVLVSIGPVTEQRDQRDLLSQYRTEIESATNEAFGLAGIEVPTNAPSRGAPVAIIDIGAIGVNRVVVEGTAPEETRQGPGHVVGTGGPGQPGNSVVVGRRSLFGGAFGSLDALEPGDRILVTTVQGQSVYEVEHAGTHRIVEEPSAADEDTAATSTLPAAIDPEVPADAASTDAGSDAVVLPDGPVTAAQVYGPSEDDRLTLVTSGSTVPWATDEALVVVARMDGVAFAPTPQGGRTLEDDGRGGSPGGMAALVLALLAYAAAVVGAVWLHRNVPWRSAYLLSAPLIVALTIVLAEQVATALPAWS
jgi:sortase A